MLDFDKQSPTLQAHLQEKAPPHLYHYTSADALIGILSHKELWASNANFMNDSTEALHALNMVSHQIAYLIEHNRTSAKEAAFLTFLKELIGSSDSHSYVVSFTELPDSLSQWRAYSPPSGGYAVGFPSEQIVNIVRSQGFRVAKCIYKHETQARIIAETVGGFVNLYTASSPQLEHDADIKALALECRDYLRELSLLMKHSSFEEEKEWRVFVSGMHTNPAIAFRANHKGVIPYFKFELTNPEFPDMRHMDKWPHASMVIRIGPCTDVHSRTSAVQLLLSNSIGNCGIGPSDIPYKPW